jgi:hypothetical protein
MHGVEEDEDVTLSSWLDAFFDFLPGVIAAAEDAAQAFNQGRDLGVQEPGLQVREELQGG